MVFSSHLFFFYFLPVSLALYYPLGPRGKHLVLVLVSYVFYGWANPWFVALMWFQTVVDFVAGYTIAQRWGVPKQVPIEPLVRGGPRTRAQVAALVAAIVSNLALLAFFKYFNFGVDNYNAVVTALGWESARWDTFFRVTLPLGISFYTFQSMSYSIDVFRGDARVVTSLLDYSCYVAMFPQLVAGPIVRFQDVADQLVFRTHTLEKFARGVAFVAFGLSKKILLANPCGKIADTVFDAASRTCSDAWFGVCAYAFQIYFDFSAYSDMAIGLGLMLGFVFVKNFDSPYQSLSVTEFWRRWHISLSTWLRDNLYIPLGGNRRGPTRTYLNLMATMLLGGLWHGASWNFVIWGGLHGGALGLERALRSYGMTRRCPRCVRLAGTFTFVLITWVFFRAADLPSSLRFLGDMARWEPTGGPAELLAGAIYQPYYVVSFLCSSLFVFFMPQVWDFTRTITLFKAMLAIAALATSLIVMESQAYNPFIYFIF